MEHIDAQTLQAWQYEGRDITLVDTLPAASFAQGHLPGAINIVSDDILRQAAISLPDKHAAIVVYCASVACKRAVLSAERLEHLGYTQIYHYTGGKKDWAAAGFPLVAG